MGQNCPWCGTYNVSGRSFCRRCGEELPIEYGPTIFERLRKWRGKRRPKR